MALVPGVRRQSIRVALAATGVVAVVYLAVGISVIAYVTRDLTAQIDSRLTASFGRLPPDGRAHDSPFDPGRDPGRPFGAPLLVWTMAGRRGPLKIANSSKTWAPGQLAVERAPTRRPRNCSMLICSDGSSRW